MDLQEQLKAVPQNLSLEKLWGFSKFSPNPEQKEAIELVDGPLYITAGPGSGKTRVLLWRTLNLIVIHNVDPKHIYLSTFTEKAAHQLKEGLRSLLGYVTNYNGTPYDLSNMYIGTVHSLCHRILTDRRRFSIDRVRNRPPSLLDELGQYFHIAKRTVWEKILTAAEIDPDDPFELQIIFETTRSSKYEGIRNLISLFNRFSEETVDAELVLKKIRKGNSKLVNEYASLNIPKENLEMALRLYIAYKDTLQEDRIAKTDFSLIQQDALTTLNTVVESENVFKYVIVDEYQDTNAIQEQIFFKLAGGQKNICVVGDDDQSLYRFRGATVENFVRFPDRCQEYLEQKPKRITLATNYRSRYRIVKFFSDFMEAEDWSREDGKSGHYRVIDKDIEAHTVDNQTSIVASDPGKPKDVTREIAHLIKDLIEQKKVKDPNQIAFLFPSLKSVNVRRMREALQAVNLEVYAPRAGTFLDVLESIAIFGLLTCVFGRPRRGDFRGHDYTNFMNWLDEVETMGTDLMNQDPYLAEFVKDKQVEIERVKGDYSILIKLVEKERWDIDSPYDIETMKRALHSARGLSDEGKKLIASAYLDRIVQQRLEEGNPLTLKYIIRRVTSVDWNLLDLFYRFCGFQHFMQFFNLAEEGLDEGPIHNMGLITQYLARFIDERMPMLTADLFREDLFQRVFFMSYLYTLFRLGEAEYEDSDDPFPKGRIPFLTIHQAKGLEFPIVVIGNPSRRNYPAGIVERMTRPLLKREGAEPLDRIGMYDNMRMFYVANSRAQKLLVLAHYHSQGNYVSEPYRSMLDENFPRISDLDMSTIPESRIEKNDLPKNYSFTADYLAYKKCARNYMVFRKYGFVPSRSETMLFGSLVHRTLEDLHHELIRRREKQLA